MSANLESADEYWGARLGGDDWAKETQARREAAILSATEAIAPYIAGLSEKDADAAIYEQAQWLLGSRADLQAAGVQSFSVTGLSESYSVTGRPAAVAPSAWRIITYGLDGTGGRKRGAVWLS